jgi:hypothetical protein
MHSSFEDQGPGWVVARCCMSLKFDHCPRSSEHGIVEFAFADNSGCGRRWALMLHYVVSFC